MTRKKGGGRESGVRERSTEVGERTTVPERARKDAAANPAASEYPRGSEEKMTSPSPAAHQHCGDYYPTEPGVCCECGERNPIADALRGTHTSSLDIAAARIRKLEARIAELAGTESLRAGAIAEVQIWRPRAEKAEARIKELEGVLGRLTARLAREAGA